MAATSIDDKCNMKIMRKHVVNKLSPYWSVVCQCLGYSTTGLGQDGKKNLIAVLEDWINSGEKVGKPRTWSMFIGVLSNISELSTVTSDICRNLNTVGVYITPPPSRSNDKVPLLIQDDTSSLTEVVDGKYSQSPAGMAATPTHSQCNMKAMHKHVASHLSPYWIMVCHHLGYSTAERDGFRQANDKKSLIAVLEHWISSGAKEGRPKTWSMFIGVLSNISELSTVTSDICRDLNNARIYFTPPSSRPHDPSPRQPEAPLLVQDDTSSLTEVADGPNKPTAAQSTPPTQKPLNMKVMYRCVVNKLSPYWTSVGDYLEYSVAERNSFKGASNNKSLAALLENWISTTNGREPKTWLTFFKVLRELDQDLSISVGSVICTSIQTELSGSSTPAQQRPSERSASDSVPPQQRHQEQQFKHSFSFPADRHPNRAPYQNRQHSDDDVRKKLVYDTSQMSIAEENPDWSLPQPKQGQSHGTAHQPSHGQKSTADPIYTIGPPPPTGNVRPSVAPPPVSMMAGPQNIQRPFHPSSNQWRHPLHGYQPAPPGRPLFPTHDYSSMASPQGPLSMGFPQDHPSLGLYSLQHSMNRIVHPNSQFQGSPRPFHPIHQRKQYQQTQSSDPQSLRQPRPQKDPRQMQMHSMYPQVDQQRYDTQHPHLIQGPHTAQGPYSTQGPQGPYSTQGPPSMQGPHPRQGPHSAQRLPPTQGQSPRQAMKQNQSLQAQQGRQHLLQSHAQAMEPQGQQGLLAAQQEPHPQQGLPSYQHTTEQQVNKQSIQHTPPQQQTLFSHQHMAGNAARSHNVTGASSVTNMNNADTSPTCSSSGGGGITSPTRWFVNFSQTLTTTQSNVQSTVRTSNVTSLVTTGTTVSSPTSENTLIANTQVSNTSSKRQMNSSNIQTNTNGVEQATSMSQSTVHNATLSATASTVAAPFKWKKGKMLGRGSFGEVFLCKDEDNDRNLAVKEVWIDPNFSNDTRQAVESLEKEIKLLQNMRHDRIVQYYGTERTNTSVRIFMEYMPGGSLYHYIDQCGVLEEQTASKYTRQLLEGVDYLHFKKIVHRDIKGANILMDLSRHIVKIADFGASKLLRSIYLSSRSHKKNNNQKSSVAGTAYWMAPEVIKGETVNHKADIWSIGCTVVEMLTSHPPYHHLEPFPAMYKIAIEPMSVDLPPEYSNTAHDFLCQCFASKISERPAASVLLKHQFVQIDVHSSCLTVQGTTVTTGSSEVTIFSQTVTKATNGNNNVAEPVAVSSDQSSSASNDDDDTPDDDPTNDNYAMAGEDVESIKQSNGKLMSPDQDEQQQQQQATGNVDVHYSANKTEPHSVNNNKTSSTIMPSATSIPTNAEGNNTEKISPGSPQLKRMPESSTTDTSNADSPVGSASNINNNSTQSKLLPEKTEGPSNSCMKDLGLWKNRQQHIQTASDAFVNNLFGNFPATQTAGPIGRTLVQMIVVQDSNLTIPPTGPSSVSIIDHREIAHNSLEPFAYDISCSVNVGEILPVLISHGLLTRSDHDYFTSKVQTHAEKLERLTCLVVSLNEDCVEKFLDCLSKTADYAPHDSLLKKINNERKTPSPSESNQ